MQFNLSTLSIAILAATSSFAYATQAEPTKLDVIDVVAEHTGAKIKTNIVTTEDVNQSTETDLRGLLREEPSINFGGGNGNSQWLTVRGMSQDQVDFKVDNTYSDTQIFHHQGRFNLLDPSLIKRVNIQKGTGSASAGIGATSGQIVATTVDAKDLLKDGRDFGFKLNSGFSSNKGYSEGGSVYGRYGNVDALISGNWVTNKDYKGGNGYRNLSGSNVVQNSGLSQRGLLAKLGIDLNEDHRVVLSHRQEHSHGVRALREEFDFTNSYVSAVKNAKLAAGQTLSSVYAGEGRRGSEYYVLDANGRYIVNSANNDPRYRITNEDTTNIQYTGHNIGVISNLDVNAYYKTVERKETDSNSTTKVVTRGANINLDSALGDNHMLKYGINWREQQGTPDSVEANIHHQEKKDIGLYAEGIWGFGPVTLTTGLRHDYFKFHAMDGKEVTDGEFNPSAGIIWEVVDGLSLNASHNYATRSPRIYEVAVATGITRGAPDVISASNHLKAERSRNTEIGFNYRLSHAVELDGSYFWQTVNDVVALRTTAMKGIQELYNGGTLKNHGYELGASYKHNGFTVRAGVADSKPKLYGDAVDANTTAMLIGRTWSTSIAYRFAQPNLELGWRGRFVESEKGSPSRGSSPSSEEINRPGYGVSDFFVNWKPTGKDDLNVNFALDNAFNKYYKSHSQRTGANALPEAGRNFRMNVNYTF